MASRYDRTIGFVKRSLPSPSVKPEQNLQPVDDLFRVAGLTRSQRTSPSVRIRRQDAATRQELAVAVPSPTVSSNGVGLLQVPAWRDRKALNRWLWHGFSTRLGGMSRAYCGEDAPGELNLGFTADDDSGAVVQNRRMLAEAVTGDADTPIIALRQFHSNLVVVASTADADRERPWKADGVITAEPGLLIAIQTADCIPVLVADKRRRVVGAFHAGWRGTVKRIVELGVGRMRLEFGSQPEDLIAAIGPGVGQCCYAVGEEVVSEFESQFQYGRELFREVFDSDPVRKKYPMLFLTQRAPGHSPIGPGLHLDLIEANRRQLLDAGLKPSAISLTGGCTSCHTELFFSHRASQGHAGRMMSVIAVRG
jgi:YfiH family protein